MGIYINSRGSKPIPSIVNIGTANMLVIGFDDANDDKFDSGAAEVTAANISDRVMRINSYAGLENCYTSIPEDTPLKMAVQTYYNEVGSDYADPAFLYLYRMKTTDTGDELKDQAAIPDGSNTSFRTEVAPVESVDKVSVSFDGEAAVEQEEAGYEVEEDDNGMLTGVFSFVTGYPKNGEGEYQTIDLKKDIVSVDYTTSGLASVFKIMRTVDVQFAMLAYDGGGMTGSTPGSGIYGGISFIDDCQKLVAFCDQCCGTGWYRKAIIGLPANETPGDDGSSYGAVGSWANMRTNDIGQNENAIVSSFQRTLATSGYIGVYDTAALMAALIRKCSVGENVGYTTVTSPIIPYESESMQQAFKDARIGTIVKISHLNEAAFLNFGNTFGIGTHRWINFVRELDQIRHLTDARIFQAMLSKPGIPYTVEGGGKIITAISAAVRVAEMNGWCRGLVGVTIPIMEYLRKMNKTAEEQKIADDAVESGIWNNVQYDVRMTGNTEQINLGQIGEVLS